MEKIILEQDLAITRLQAEMAELRAELAKVSLNLLYEREENKRKNNEKE